MRVLAVHNFHRKDSSSGDDQVFRNETALLKAHGDRVFTYTASNDEFDNATLPGKIISTLGMFWSFKHYRNLRKKIDRCRPDVVHIHTSFPMLSPSVFYAAKSSGVPVVVTLHDTRLICPCASSIRDGKICNKCHDGKYFRMCRYRCFKGSAIQSFIVASVFKLHRTIKTFYSQPDIYICLNNIQMRLLAKTGFDRNKMVKKYNFCPLFSAADRLELPSLPDRYVVYYGRLGEEKGIHTLMSTIEQTPEVNYVVMGGGPLEDEFRAFSDKMKNVLYLGYTEHDKCLQVTQNAEFVVFPSICYEGCSMVVIETESTGTPLIASDIGFSKEAVKDGYNGYKCRPGDAGDFVSKIRLLWNAPEKCREFGKNALEDYKLKYSPEENYRQLKAVYKKAGKV